MNLCVDGRGAHGGDVEIADAVLQQFQRITQLFDVHRGAGIERDDGRRIPENRDW